MKNLVAASLARNGGVGRWTFWGLAGGIVAASLLTAGCGTEQKPISASNSEFKVSEETPDNGTTAVPTDPTKTPDGPAPKPLTPPKRIKPAGEGTDAPVDPAERYALMLTQIERMQPKGTNQQEIQESIGQILGQRIQVAQELFNVTKLDQHRMRAVDAIVDTFEIMQQMGDPRAGDAMAKFAEALVQHKSPVIALRGRQMVLQFSLEDLVESKGELLPQFLKQVDELLVLSQDESNFVLLQKVCTFLNQNKMGNESKEVLARLVKTFEKHENPDIVADVAVIREMQALSDLGLNDAITAYFKKQPGAGDALLELLKKGLAGELVGKGTLSQMQQIASMLEGEDVTLATTLGNEIEATFSKHSDAKLAKEAAHFIENSRKHLALIGKEFVVAGKTLDGETFDWAPYQGKVVLVDFWATWCRPCLEEIPNIRESYANYHEQGFEVIGVNLDDETEAATKFLAVQPLEWATIVSSDAANAGFKNPLAVACGVEAIPFVMLIGKDGKVDSIHVRGKRLSDRLAKLLGPLPTEGKRPEVKPASGEPGEDAPVNTLRKKTSLRQVTAEHFVVAELPTSCAAEEEKAVPSDEKPANPYAAKPNMTTEQLIEFLLRMEDKPKVIQLREGFSAALVEACDRILAANPTEVQALVALETKGRTLHRWAGRGDATAEVAWRKFTAELRNDTRPRVARMIDLFDREQKIADAANGPVEAIGGLIKETKEYLGNEKLDNRHLRLASNTVALVNRLDDGDLRESHFKELGQLFAKSRDKELARYGKKLAQGPGDESDLIGKQLELVGTTLKDQVFDIQTLRGKVVVVDFWATWCGPCRKELPRLEAVFEKFHPQGLEVVGVSMDADLDALAAFLEEHPLPWTTLAGETNQALADKYGVRGLPTLMVVDRTGKIAGVAHSIEQLKIQVEKLLAS